MCHAPLCQEHGSQSKQKKERMCVFAIKDPANFPGSIFFLQTLEHPNAGHGWRGGLLSLWPWNLPGSRFVALKKWSNFDSMKCCKGGLGESCRRSEVVNFQFAFEVVPSIAVLSWKIRSWAVASVAECKTVRIEYPFLMARNQRRNMVPVVSLFAYSLLIFIHVVVVVVRFLFGS